MTLGGFIRVFLGLYVIYLAYTAIRFGLASAGWTLLAGVIATVIAVVHVLLQERVKYGEYVYWGALLTAAGVVIVWTT